MRTVSQRMGLLSRKLHSPDPPRFSRPDWMKSQAIWCDLLAVPSLGSGFT